MNKPTGTLLATQDRSSSPARFTSAEFLRMAEAGAFDDMKVELVDGELERMTPPMSNHAALQARTMIRIASIIAPDLVCGEVGIDLGNDTIVACDVAVMHTLVDGNRLLRSDDLALVVEIAETTVKRDTGMKRLKYAAVGIPLYWVVDGARSVVHVYTEPVDGDYAQINTVRFGEPLAVPGTERTITLG